MTTDRPTILATSGGFRPAHRTWFEFDALVPYARGDLIDKLHSAGEIDALEHTPDGTRVRGRATEELAGHLTEYAV